MEIVVLSIDYKKAPIEVLEASSCNKDDITHYLSTLIPTIFFDEMVVISTCNRTEWVFTTIDFDKAIDILFKTISEKTHIAVSILRKQSSIYKYKKAIQHLFDLVCGLKSMVLGENEILAQIKIDYLFCFEFGATNGFLNKLFNTLISTGKEVRTKTYISKGAHSISSIAIEAIKEVNVEFIKEPLLLIGAGVMVQRALAKLASMGHQKMSISNRNMSKAEDLANNYNALTVIPYACINNELHRFNTIYVGIRSKSYLFNSYHLEKLNGKKTIVDLGVPRNVDPKCNLLSNVNLISIDQLDVVAKKTISKRQHDIPKVHQLIQDAVNDMVRWQEYRNKAQLCPIKIAFA